MDEYQELEFLNEYCEFAEWQAAIVLQTVEGNFDGKFHAQQALLATISNLLLALASSYPPDKRVDQLNNFLISFKRILPDKLDNAEEVNNGPSE